MATLQRLALRGTPKATKAAARYTPAGGAERCGMCRHYVPSSSCARIEGPVSAAGWCQLYSQQVTWRPRAGQAAGGSIPFGVALDLSFMTSGSLDPRITFTRASTATYFNAAGVMQIAPVDTPRWDYNPVTHALNGMLLEDVRTNLLLNSATLSTQSVTTTAVPTTLSFYGTGTVTLTGTSTAGPLTGTGAANRVSLTFTPTAGTLTCTVTGSVLNAQIEAAPTPTSYIPTTATTATRATETASMSTSPWFNLPASSLSSEVIVPYTAGVQYVSAELDDGTINNLLGLRLIAPSNVNAFAFVANALVGNVSPGTFTANAVIKAAVAANNTSLACASSMNGSAAASFTLTGAIPAMSRLSIGRGRTSAINGWMRRISYWPRVLSSTELQSVTT